MTLGKGLYGLKEAEIPRPPPTRRQVILRRIRKIFIILFCCMTASLAMLNVLGGNSPEIKANVELYLQESLGMKAHVGTLHYLGFYPALMIDAEDIALTDDKGDSAGTIDRIRFSISFWSTLSGQPRFRVFNLENGWFRAGFITPRDVLAQSFRIDPDKKILIFAGTYGGKPLAFHVDLSVKTGLAGIPSFNFAKIAGFEINAGDISAAGSLTPSVFKGLGVKIDRLRDGQSKELTADLLISDKVTGALNIGRTILRPDIAFGERDSLWTLKGALHADFVDGDDLQTLLEMIGSVRDFIGQSAIQGTAFSKLQSISADLSFDAANFVWGRHPGQPFKGSFKLSDGAVSVAASGPVSGILSHLWDGRLARVILAGDDEIRMACGLVLADIKDGPLRIGTIMADTDAFSLRGEGVYAPESRIVNIQMGVGKDVSESLEGFDIQGPLDKPAITQGNYVPGQAGANPSCLEYLNQ